MTEHNWVEYDDRIDYRRDFVCNDCGRTKIVIFIPLAHLLPIIGLIVALVALFPGMP